MLVLIFDVCFASAKPVINIKIYLLLWAILWYYLANLDAKIDRGHKETLILLSLWHQLQVHWVVNVWFIHSSWL